MFKTFKVVAGAAALVCASMSAQAAGLVVDLFNTDQAELVDTVVGGGVQWNQIGSGAPGVIGGYRELGVEKVGGANTPRGQD